MRARVSSLLTACKPSWFLTFTREKYQFIRSHFEIMSPEDIATLKSQITSAQTQLAAERHSRPHVGTHISEMHFLIAKHINRARIRKGYSGEEFADRIGVSEEVVANWLNTRHGLTVDAIARMHVALGEPVVMVSDQEYRSFEGRGLEGTARPVRG